MIFIDILNNFCKEMNVFIDLSSETIESYDISNKKQAIKIIANCEIKNSISISGIRSILDYHSKNEIIFAIIQKIGFNIHLDSHKNKTEIIETLKFLTQELQNALNCNFSLQINDFPGRNIINMIFDMILSKELTDDYFNPEMHILNIYNECVDKKYQML